jgi:O-antigen ligase
MLMLLIGFLALLPFQHVVLLPGGMDAARVYAGLLGLAWLAGYLVYAGNRGRVQSLAPWLLAGTIAACLVAVPFGADPGASMVRWFRFVVLWLAFLVAVPATLTTERSWRWAALAFVASGALFGLLNYWEYARNPGALVAEIVARPTGFVIRNVFSFGGGAEGHGHEVGHFASFALLWGVGLAISARARWEWWVLMGLLLIASGALLISFTKSAWAGLGVGLVVLYWTALRGMPVGRRVAPWGWVPVVAIMVLGAVFWTSLPEQTRAWLIQNFLFRDVSGTQRFMLWARTLELAWQHPLVGAGLNSARLIGGDPHNWWLEILAEGGFLAFICALAGFWRLGRELAPEGQSPSESRVIRGTALAVVASIAFQGLFEASFLWDFPTWVALGLATAVVGLPARPALAAETPMTTALGEAVHSS